MKRLIMTLAAMAAVAGPIAAGATSAAADDRGRYDRREDRGDRREDRRDRREDYRDARRDDGRWDRREDRWDLAAFGLVTTKLPAEPPKPHVVMHQEFSLTDFRHEAPEAHDPLVVSSFVNCFAENQRGYAQFRDTAALRPALDWRVYGAYGSVPEDEYARGNLPTCAGVADAMRAT
jgi:Ni/Co efflux regulator RcnB